MSEIVSLTATDARALTDRIKVGVEAVWDLITQAYVERAWGVLGYSSWDDYCTREFGTSRLRLPREERSEVVASLRESGLSIRAIAAATGDSPRTVRRSLESGGAYATPAPAPFTGMDSTDLLDELTDDFEAREVICEQSADSRFISDNELAELNTPVPEPIAPKPITGIDGKTYTPKSTQKEPRRKPLEAGFFDATMRLNKAVTSLENLGKDDRLPRNKDQVARYRNDLIRAIDALQRVANQLT